MSGKMICFNEEEREWLLRLVESSSISSFSVDGDDIARRVLGKLRMPWESDEDQKEFDYA